MTYTPNPNVNGADNFAFQVNDGQVDSSPATVALSVTPVNDEPSFTAGPSPTVNEDAGAQVVPGWATLINDGDPEVAQTLSFEFTANSNPGLFASPPAISPTGTLSFASAANASGSATLTVQLRDNGGTANGGDDLSPPVNFTITVSAVNDAPTFTPGGDVVLPEDDGPQSQPWATAIDDGDPDLTQNLNFVFTANSNPGLFAAGPAISPTGELSFTAGVNANGSAMLTVELRDDGGTANGGDDSSTPVSFTITVSPINDEPTFTPGGDVTVPEDSADPQLPWATAIDDGDPEVAQNLSFEFTANSNPGLFNGGPVINSSGVLSFTPATNVTGSATVTVQLRDDGGTANGGDDLSPPVNFTITVNAVNDAPTFTPGGDVVLPEDDGPQSQPWATAIDDGDPDLTQNLNFVFTANSNPGLFAAGPAISPTGELSFTAGVNANGSATLTVELRDDGGTANGGDDSSTPVSFTITVSPINDEPTFTPGGDVTVPEDSADPQLPWAIALNDGDAEVTQNLSFEFTANSNPGLFNGGPVINSSGVLSFTPATNMSGSATLTVQLRDDGGTANGGDDLSPPVSFTITVNAVNDAPTVTATDPPTVDEDSGAQSLPFAVFNPGPADEAGQGVQAYTVSLISNPGLFSAGPAVDNSGVLTYTPAADAAGSSSFTLTVTDDGGTANGGLNTSAPQTFTITVNAINDAPVNTVPGAQTVAGGTRVFSAGNGNAISVSDVDAGSNAVRVNLGVTAGTLAATAAPGATLLGNGTAAVQIDGPLSAINAALEGLAYTAGGPGTDQLTVLSSDLGNSGAGGPLTDTDIVPLQVDSPPSVSTVSPLDGATQQASNVAVTVSFSEAINAAAGALQINCTPSGASVASVAQANVTSLGFTGPAIGAAPGDQCAVQVNAAQVTDVDSIDPPDLMLNNFNSLYTIDTAPQLTLAVPVDGATVATDAFFEFSFNEPVSGAAGAIELNCAGAVPGAISGSGTTTLRFTPSAALTPGSACVATLVAANVSDLDAGDPPNNPAGNTVLNVTVDAAPTLVSTVPVAAAIVATNPVLSFTFSEPVTNLGGAITLDCAGAIGGVIGGSGTSTLTFTPSAALAEGAACTATVVALQIADVDSLDPPQNPVSGSTLDFTVDSTPSVTSTVPANGALLQSPSGTITINFSEAVNFDTSANAANGSFDLVCPAATDFTVLTASPASTVVLDPVDTAIAGQSCTLSIRSAGISDADAADPPNNLLNDIVVGIGYDDPAIVVDDAYNATPHLLLTIGSGAPQGGGVLANDTVGSSVISGFGPAGNCSAVVPNGSNVATSTAGGSVVLALDGSFSYSPPAGLVENGGPTAEDGFCYTVSGGGVGNVAFNLAPTDLVWFVDASAAGGGDGTQLRPVQTVNAAVAASTANDTVYIADGNYPATQVTLLANQRLIGDGSSSTLAALTGITPVAGSSFPNFSGTPPVLSCTNVVCVALNNSGVANTHLLRGFTIGNSGATGTDIAGTNFGTVTVSELSLNGDGTALNLVGGTLNGSFLDLDSSAGSVGVNLSTVGGAWSVVDNVAITAAQGFTTSNQSGTVTLNGGITINSPGFGLRVLSNTATWNLNAVNLTAASAVLRVDGGAVNVSSGSLTATSGSVLELANTTANVNLSGAGATLTGTAVGVAINAISGTVTVGNGGNISGEGSDSLSVAGSAGTFSYAGNIGKTNSGRLVFIDTGASGTVNLTGNLSCSACGNGTSGGILIRNRSGGSYSFGGSTSLTTGIRNAVELFSNSGATVAFTGGLAISTSSGAAFTATGGGTVTVQGAGNTITTNTGQAVNVSSTTIGAAGISFASLNSTGVTTSNLINLSNTGAGPFSITGTGAAGSGGTVSNREVDTVVLNNTGGLVRLDRMILEDIGSMAGGFDTQSGHDAISGTNVNGGLSLTGTTIRRVSDHAIYGESPAGWVGLTLDGVTIEDTNRFHVAGIADFTNEEGVFIDGISGTVNIQDSTFRRSTAHLTLIATGGTLNLTVQGSAFENAYKEFTSGSVASVGRECIRLLTSFDAVATAVIGSRTVAADENTFENCALGSILVINRTAAAGRTDVTIARNSFRTTDHSSGFGGDFSFPQSGVQVRSLESGVLPMGPMNSIIENNSFTDVGNASGIPAQLAVLAEGGLHQALVANNTFTRPGNAPWFVTARNYTSSDLRIQFRNNTGVFGPYPCTLDLACAGGYNGPGLRALADVNGGGNLDLTIDNDDFALHDTFFDPGQTLEVRSLNVGGAAAAGNRACVNVQNSTSPDGYSLEEFAGTMRVFRAGGSGSCAVGGPSAACVTLFQNNGNTGGAGSAATNPPFVGVVANPVDVTSTACPVPTGGPFP